VGDKTDQKDLCTELRAWKGNCYTFINNLTFVGIPSNISLAVNLDLTHLDYGCSLASLHAWGRKRT